MGHAHFEHADFLDAARELAREGGPAQVTVASVTDLLKAPKGSFYYRFASRNLLLGELWLATALAFQEGFSRPRLCCAYRRSRTHRRQIRNSTPLA